jgi:hypothetical protein
MRAGVGTAIITPATPVRLAGYGDRHEAATTVHDDLEARVLVLEAEDGVRRAGLVTCDLLAMSPEFADATRDAVAHVVETDREYVLPSCTHVHGGPSTLAGSEAIGWPVPDGYLDLLTTRVTDAARAACAMLAPVEARFARTRLPPDVAMNRRGHPLTPSAAVLVLDPVAVVANFGIHPTVTGPSNVAITTDWVGAFRRAVEARRGMVTLFLQGCQGDVNPSITAWDDGAPDAWEPVVNEFARVLGRCIADAAARARHVRLDLTSARSRVLRVPVGDTLLAHLAGREHERSVELVEWTLGDARLVAVPGEGFHGVEHAIRATRTDPVLIAGLAPEWHGYLPLPYTDGYEEGLSLGPDAVAQLVDALR